MKTLRQYVVNGGLFAGDGKTPAAVGDQVRLYLDTEAHEDFPEYIVGTIQHPVAPTLAGTAISYSFEYDEADLDDVVANLIIADVVSVEVFSAVDTISENLTAHIENSTLHLSNPIASVRTILDAANDAAASSGVLALLAGDQIISGSKTFTGSVAVEGLAAIQEASYNGVQTWVEGSTFGYGVGVAALHRAALGIQIGDYAGTLAFAPIVTPATPTTGGTISPTRYVDETHYVIPAGTLANLTWNLPLAADSRVGQVKVFLSTQTITALTVTVLGSGTKAGVALTAAVANEAYSYQCVSTSGNGTWLRIS